MYNIKQTINYMCLQCCVMNLHVASILLFDMEKRVPEIWQQNSIRAPCQTNADKLHASLNSQGWLCKKYLNLGAKEHHVCRGKHVRRTVNTNHWEGAKSKLEKPTTELVHMITCFPRLLNLQSIKVHCSTTPKNLLAFPNRLLTKCRLRYLLIKTTCLSRCHCFTTPQAPSPAEKVVNRLASMPVASALNTRLHSVEASACVPHGAPLRGGVKLKLKSVTGSGHELICRRFFLKANPPKATQQFLGLPIF